MQTIYFPFRPAINPSSLPAQKTIAQQDLPRPGVSVHQLINKLMKDLQPLALKRSNIILNGIPGELTMAVEENLLAYVLWNLINSAVNSAKNECIHIVALFTDDGPVIDIKNVGTYFYQAFSREYRKVQQIAEKIGGSIRLDDDKKDGAHVIFSLLNSKPAA